MIASRWGLAQGGTPEEHFVQLDIPCLHGFGEEERRRLAAYLETRRFAPGAVILAPGAPPPALHFILSGEVSLSRQASLPLPRERALLGRGHVCGLKALVPEMPLVEGAHAMTPTLVLALTPPQEQLARQRMPRLMERLAELVALHAQLPLYERDFLRALRAAPVLGKVNARFLSDLYQHAELHAVAAGTQLGSGGRRTDERYGPGIYYVVAGQLSVSRHINETERVPCRTWTGEAFIDGSLIGGTEQIVSIVAERPTIFVYVSRKAYLELCRQAPAFRRAIRIAKGDRPPASP
ncbi:MAG TPA: cyclic nucleotide-binding domain-containing protein [Polyangia bacterium]|nr:cyclic nucleotide-binding domain-containing protein [Polyangia bacterium]